MRANSQTKIKFPKIVARPEWQKARDALLVKEKAANARPAMRWPPSAAACRW